MRLEQDRRDFEMIWIVVLTLDEYYVEGGGGGGQLLKTTSIK